jgi:hypothetical protein
VAGDARLVQNIVGRFLGADDFRVLQVADDGLSGGLGWNGSKENGEHKKENTQCGVFPF